LIPTPAAAKRSKNLPAMRNAERLAAAKGDVRNTRIDDILGEPQRSISAQFVGPCVIGA
jgi:hypothetical protein